MEKVFFKGHPYTGDAAFINGSNGYECTEDHGLLCALILPEGPFEHVRSCWDKSGKPNCLTTETGKKIVNRGETGIIIKFKDGLEVSRFRQRTDESLKEKAVSKAQRGLMGAAYAYKKGETKNVSPKIKKIANSMSKKDLKDFAGTKEKGLPKHVDESTLVRLIRESIQEHLIDVMKRYTQGKATSEEANKAIMDLANSNNMKLNERNNRPFYDYAQEYKDKHGKKLPDEILKSAAKKNDERFHNRKK